MSWLDTAKKRGRRNAKNFTYERAQKRLNEALPIFQQQIENALQVDKVHAVIAKRLRTGRYCTCCKRLESINNIDTTLIDLDPENEQTVSTSVSVTPDAPRKTINVDLGPSSLFGSDLTQRDNTEPLKSNRVELGDFETEERNKVKETATTIPLDFEDLVTEGTGVDCGICFREGREPPFEFTNYRQSLMTSLDIGECYGYYLDDGAPCNIVQQDKEGYVCFDILVPKYFISVEYSIRNNTSVLPSSARFYLDNTNELLTKQHLENSRGKAIRICVRNVATFTHCIVMFKLSNDSIQANISQENEMINYENEVTIGDITVVLPARVGLFRSEDFIIIPERNLVLKVNDNPRKSTADRQVWEWMATTRAVQRSEATNSIFKHYKLY
jgi:hypothetical protein